MGKIQAYNFFKFSFFFQKFSCSSIFTVLHSCSSLHKVAVLQAVLLGTSTMPSSTLTSVVILFVFLAGISLLLLFLIAPTHDRARRRHFSSVVVTTDQSSNSLATLPYHSQCPRRNWTRVHGDHHDAASSFFRLENVVVTNDLKTRADSPPSQPSPPPQPFAVLTSGRPMYLSRLLASLRIASEGTRRTCVFVVDRTPAASVTTAAAKDTDTIISSASSFCDVDVRKRYLPCVKINYLSLFVSV